MSCYLVEPEGVPAGARPLAAIDGASLWTLPSRIGCPECGVYASIGPAYPTVDLAGWLGEEALRAPSAASWRQFAELASRLTPVVAGAVRLSPGTELGPFTGRVRGGPADFILGPIHRLFLTAVAHARLASAGVALPPVVPVRPGRGGRARAAETAVKWLELEVTSGGRLAAAAFTPRRPAACGTCGRWERTLERPALEAGSAPTGATLLRPTNHATVVLASAGFVAAVRAAELTGLAFTPIDAVEPDA